MSNKVEITPRMIEAGYEVLASSGRLIEGPLSSDRLLCSEVFQAMWNQRADVETPVPENE